MPGAGPLRPLVVARRGQVGDAAVRRIDEVILHEMYHVSPAARRAFRGLNEVVEYLLSLPAWLVLWLLEWRRRRAPPHPDP